MKKKYYSFIVLLMSLTSTAQTTTTTPTTTTTSPVGIGLFAAPIGGGGGGGGSYKWNADMDRDGFGDPLVYVYANTKPYGYVSNQSDLDDSNPNITNIPPQTFYRDADGDTYGSPTVTVYYSVKPAGYVTNNLDCNDGDATLNPNTIWYRDADGDGYGASSPTTSSCTQPGGYVRNSNDYNDTTVNITNIAPQTFYRDADGDGYGNPSVTVYYSIQPGGYVANSLDCNDGDATLNPTTVWYRDADGDGYGTSATTTTSCTQPTGYVRNASDYNDGTVNITNIAPQTFYRDGDGDGYGSPSVTVFYSVQPGGYVTNSLDCNDGDATLNPNTVWYRDADGDGYGIPATTTSSCTQPTGYVRNSTDCNDGDATLNPNTVWYRDADGDGYGTSATTTTSCTQPTGYVRNSNDYNDTTVNITNIAPQTFYRDADGDGYGSPTVTVYYSVKPTGYVTNNLDCNDGDATLNPTTVWYRDADGDGYGTSATTTTSCTQPTGYVRNASDYNDGTVNITNIAPQTFYRDADGDGYGSPVVTVFYSVQPGGYVTNSLDCNDGDVTLNPNTVWYRDADGDGYGTPATTTSSCTQPTGYVRNSTDCNDGDTTLNPTTIWYRDADGDGYGSKTVVLTQCAQPIGYIRTTGDYDDSTVNITNIAPQTFYRDADGDGYGNPSVTVFYSVQPTGYVTNTTDCNDGDASLNPNTLWYADADGDGYGSKTVVLTQCAQPIGYIRTTGDFDDSTVNITNIAPQTFYRDADGDTYGSPTATVYYSVQPTGYVTNNLDCADDDATLNPNTVWYSDADGDGYGTTYPTTTSCTQPTGYVLNNLDINDALNCITTTPRTTYVYYQDIDNDGFGDPSKTIIDCSAPAGYVSNNLDICPTIAGTENGCQARVPSSSFSYPLYSSNFNSSATNTVVGAVTLSNCNLSVNFNVYFPTPIIPTNSIVLSIPIALPNMNLGTLSNPQGYSVSIYNNRLTISFTTYSGGSYPTPVSSISFTGGGNLFYTYYRDSDGDGKGNPNATTQSCTVPTGYVTDATDLDDTQACITNVPPQTFYADTDGDGFGSKTNFQSCSTQPTGYVTNSSDYDDGTVNITNIAPQTFYRDADGDTYGSKTVSVYYSAQPTGYVTNNSDYDDGTVNITNIAPQTFYRDVDGDGFGNVAVNIYYSVLPAGYVANNTDCNDQDFNINPNMKWYADVDGDGLGDPASFVTQCMAPAGYVLDATDHCPDVPGTNADCSALPSPSQDMNYIITRAYQQATSTPLVAPSPEQAQVQITYFDGLGRPMQQIANQQSATGKDIVTPIAYDVFGRQTKDYLPFASSSRNMAYDSNAIGGNLSFYSGLYPNTQNPFSEKVLESSPLNRVLKQAAPGTDWAVGTGHEIKLDYQTNTADEVKRFDVSLTADYVPSITANASYAASELYKTVTTDENNNNTEEFKDKEGHVVLKRNYDNSVAHDTYYVYDVYGNLTYVLPPKAEGDTSPTVLDELCYQYQYDYRNRLVAKKLPGKQWEFMVYDKLDRVVATGPAFSPFSDVTGAGWLITKYDVFNRVVYTGWLNSPATSSARGTMQQAQTNATTINENKQASGTIDTIAVNYSNNVAPTTFRLLTVNYYDDYAIPNVSGLATSVANQTVTTATKGLATGSWTRVPTTTAEVKAETTSILYDYKYRPIRSYTTNYLGGYTYTDSKLDIFSGQLQYTVQKHKRTGNDAELTVKEAFTYSPQKRLLTHTHQINGGAEQLLADNTYDELGKLTSKKVGNTSATPLQKVDYSYNIRGWLTKINEIGSLQQGTDPADLFSFQLNYNTVDGNTSAANKLYNGNISETFWRTATDGGFVRNYGYKYDNLNRLKEANYQKSGQLTNMYNEKLNYDKNGNIKNLSRNGDRDEQYLPIQIDNLEYGYATNSNKLLNVSDNSNNTSGFKDGNTIEDDYVYDANGNMTVDKNKNITAITYNHLNLPTKIIFPTGNIVYFYTASGQKVQKVVTENTTVTTTDYLGGYHYQNTVLQYFPTAEGYVKNTLVSGTNTYSYVFNYTDHLGNTRLSYAKDTTTGSLKILEENNYYPFGLKHNSYNVDNFQPDYKYKYNGKEYQDELGLNMTDMDFRQYDPAIGRFVVIDPLAEFQRKWTPYHFGYDNPVLYNDPTGLEGEEVTKKKKDDKDPTVNGGTLKEVVVKRHKKSTASNVASILWRGVDFIPFAGSIKQISVGIYEGNMTDVALGTVFLAVDVFTAGEGGEALRLAEEGAEAVVKIGIEDETKELVEQNLMEIAEDAVHGNSASSMKATGNYEIVFESGKTYNGVGKAARMEKSAKSLSNGVAKGDKIVSKTWKGASNKKLAYIREHLHIQAYGGASKAMVKNYNQINSPGKKIYEAIKSLK